ncbi:hypothetical protein LIER_14892 [Lithospermum erythrorhizon]|uniref:PDZ domain-containing protein n=1 Tax=Lithospermum erythrorhizon TaxID=34254 RepID=A0AAV3Q0S7_LITER
MPFLMNQGEHRFDPVAAKRDTKQLLTTNPYLNKAVSKVSPSIVRITFSTGNELRVRTWEINGTIFSSIPDDDDGTFVSYIFTSADPFQRRKAIQGVTTFSKIDVCVPTGKLYEGEVMACDLEINVSVIKIKTDDSLPTATLTPFSDLISASPFGVSECHGPFCQSPYPTKVFPGDEVTVVCCEFGKSSDAIVCSGKYLVDYIGFGYDHRPFLRINCKNIIDGAPVINCEGDVIGVAFNICMCVAFLPVNLFFKWWKQVVTYGEIRRPRMGIQITNLYTADIAHLEAIVHDCGVSEGVLVEVVHHGSPAYSAKMRSKDVICQCDGRPVRSFLEFTELLWDKSGEVIEVTGVRDGRHFVWQVEIEMIKTEILPESFSKYVFTKDIKTGIQPESLAGNVVTKDIEAGVLPKSLAETVVTNKKSAKKGKNKTKDKKKTKKDKEAIGVKAKKRKRVVKDGVDSDAADRKKRRDSSSVPRIKAVKTSILRESLAENVVTEAIKTEVLPESSTENVAARKRSAKRGKDKAKDKKKMKMKMKKDKEVTGLKAKTRKRE